MKVAAEQLRALLPQQLPDLTHHDDYDLMPRPQGFGAVKAAVQHIDQKDSLPGSINGLVELIKPVVGKVHGQPGEIVENVTRANVNAGVEKLKDLQPILAPRVKAESVKVVGGIYNLNTGAVKLLEPTSK